MGIVTVLAAYGIYAFIQRGLWKYLTLQQPFFFLDMERGYLLFVLDYLAVMALFALAIHLASSKVKLTVPPLRPFHGTVSTGEVANTEADIIANKKS